MSDEVDIRDGRRVGLPVHAEAGARRAFGMHSRVWQGNRYVYPVVSRRSKGISIGVNLNPDKVCNFDCIYCSVDRRGGVGAAVGARDVDLSVLRVELERMVEVVRTGEIYRFDPFEGIPEGLRRVNDIAFSGDGEPTTCPQFEGAVRVAAEVKDRAGMGGRGGVKLVLITNATMFHRAGVREALAFMDEHEGEVWAKLDAGTAGYYEVVDRSGVGFERVLENVGWCCRERATVIQSLFMRVHGERPAGAEVGAYAGRLRGIVAGGGRIKLVQLYTVARGTTEAYATALSEGELEEIARVVRREVDVPVEVYP